VERAREVVGPSAPQVDKIRVFYNHPSFILANAERISEALGRLPIDMRSSAHLAFTAHSIPSAMAANCDYERQLTETCRLVAESLGIGVDRWRLVYQSRSGRPTDPWLEPDILDHLADLKAKGAEAVVVHPVGFLSDHMEVVYDLDEEARHASARLGLTTERSRTVGTHPAFVAMLAGLIRERIEGWAERPAVGRFGPSHDVCPVDCCLPPARSQAPGRA
jgi:ferrochelatase